MVMSKKYRRLSHILLAITAMAIVVCMLSSILSYFHTGTSEINKYDKGISMLDNHDPETIWLEDDYDIGGNINEYIRKDIEDAYTDAWGILNLSIKEKTDLGLTERFSDEMVQKIIPTLDIEQPLLREDLIHKLKLHFISLDKQVISITDKDMVMSTTISENGHQNTIKDTSDYKVIMTLSDGKWKIHKLVRI